jgi:hypothetical protein
MFVDICIRALGQSTKAVQILEATQRIAKQAKFSEHILTEEEIVRVKKRASEVEEFANQQKGVGFSYLFSLAVVRLWSILEAMVDDLVIDFLRRPDECKDKDLIYSLKGPLLEFATAPPERQADFLTERLKDAVKAGLQAGVGRFEAMLDPIGLGGGIDPDVRRVLFELSQVRNAIVHKAGIPDQRFIDNCPWLNLNLDEPINVNAENFQLYYMSAYYYAIEIRLRTEHFWGYERPQEMTDLLSESAETIKQLWSDRKSDNPEALLTAES